MKRVLPWSFAALLLAVIGSSRAQAQVNCADLPNPIWLQVGDTQEPLLKDLGKKMRELTTHPMAFIYVTSGSCSNTLALYNGTKITSNPRFIPTQTEVPGWTTAMMSPTCINTPAGHDIDVANSAVFIEACAGQTKPNNVTAVMAPNQPYVFAVPRLNNTATAITAAEAFFVFGYADGAGMAPPWDMDAFKFIRPDDKSTLVAMAANIRVPVGKWHGMPQATSTLVVNMLIAAGATMPEKAIGILGAEIYDRNTTMLKSLAFKAFGQTKAYWPDSTATAKDKRSMRDGHYAIWSPTVYLAKKIPGTGQPSTIAQEFMNLVNGVPITPNPGFDSLDSVVAVGLVPECAMQVTRCAEGGPLKPYAPAAPCGCYFESKTTANPNPPGCTACPAGTCATGVCRRGFCEAR